MAGVLPIELVANLLQLGLRERYGVGERHRRAVSKGMVEGFRPERVPRVVSRLGETGDQGMCRDVVADRSEQGCGNSFAAETGEERAKLSEGRSQVAGLHRAVKGLD